MRLARVARQHSSKPVLAQKSIDCLPLATVQYAVARRVRGDGAAIPQAGQSDPRPHVVTRSAHHRSRVTGSDLRHKVRSGPTGLAPGDDWHTAADTLDKMPMRVARDLQFIRSWPREPEIKRVVEARLTRRTGKHVY
jgi:hypothetical protein